MNTDAIWNKLLNTIKPKMSPLLFDTWFKDTKLLELDGEKAIVIVPTPAHKKHLSVMYNEMIEDIEKEREKLSVVVRNTTLKMQQKNEKIDMLLAENQKLTKQVLCLKTKLEQMRSSFLEKIKI